MCEYGGSYLNIVNCTSIHLPSSWKMPFWTILKDFTHIPSSKRCFELGGIEPCVCMCVWGGGGGGGGKGGGGGGGGGRKGRE